MTMGIYKIENLINSKIYIGQSIHIEKRWQEHCRRSNNSLISKAIQKYGKENFSFQILEEVSDINLLNNLEAKYILEYNTLAPNGYNVIYIDDKNHHQFNSYSFTVFQNIIKDIKNPRLTFTEIAKKYEIDLSMVYYLNRGDYHTLPDEIYPLRPVMDLSKRDYFCCDCGIKIAKGSKRCIKCAHILQQKAIRPDREELKNLIRILPFTKIGQIFKVTDNTIRRWCKAENLPYRSSDIKKYSNDEWLNV